MKFGKKIQGIHILVSKKTSRGRFNLDAKKIVLGIKIHEIKIRIELVYDLINKGEIVINDDNNTINIK